MIRYFYHKIEIIRFFLLISSLSNHFSCDAIKPKQLMKYHYINHEPLIQEKKSVYIM